MQWEWISYSNNKLWGEEKGRCRGLAGEMHARNEIILFDVGMVDCSDQF